MEMMKIDGWVLYTMWAVLGLMLLDFLIGLIRSIVTKSFSLQWVLGYFKNVLYHVFPLLIIISLIPIDPTGWILFIFYLIGGLALIIHYLIEIGHKWRA